MSQVKTVAPAARIASTVARPMPPPPAVTNALVPSREICMQPIVVDRAGTCLIAGQSQGGDVAAGDVTPGV